MAITIELRPEEERALREQARASGCDLAGYIHGILRSQAQLPREPDGTRDDGDDPARDPDDLIDREAIKSCGRTIEGAMVPSIEEVRQRLSKIPGSMARVVIEEREDRF